MSIINQCPLWVVSGHSGIDKYLNWTTNSPDTGKQHLGQADKKAVEIDDNRNVEDFNIDELQQMLADYRSEEAIADKKLKH